MNRVFLLSFSFVLTGSLAVTNLNVSESFINHNNIKPLNNTQKKVQPDLHSTNVSESVINQNIGKPSNNTHKKIQPDQHSADKTNQNKTKHSNSSQGVVLQLEPEHIVHVHVHEVNPCRNGGTLIQEKDGISRCVCPPHFKGSKCEDAAHCFSSPCKNGGTCTETDAGFSGFSCKCTRNFIGSTCEEQDFCNPNPCSENAVCVEKVKGYKCVCKEGWKGQRCKNIDPCHPNPCQNGGFCSDINGNVHCQCPPRYIGSRCTATSVCYSSPCRNGGSCVENPDAPCRCDKGYIGTYCEVNVCKPNPCLSGGVCEVIPESHGDPNWWEFRCNCPKLYRGRRCERPNFCATLPCLNGGTCVDAFDHGSGDDYGMWPSSSLLGYYCVCPNGFTGKKCETDKCKLCHKHAVCIEHRCVCKDRYTGDGLQCTEMKNVCVPNPCQSNGTCVPGPHESYDCHCPRGYCGPHCESICHPCLVNPCPYGSTCIETGESRVCHCPPGYTGPECNVLLPNLCEPTSPCQNHGTCQYLPDKHDYFCHCVGYFNGKNCEGCGCPKAKNATTVDSYCDNVGECKCPEMGDASAILTKSGCVVKGNPVCLPDTCLHGGTCLVTAGFSFKCLCKPPYYGKQCECTMCTCDNPCLHGATCHDDFSGKTTAGYTCVCPKGYRGKNCEVTAIVVIEPHCIGKPCRYGGTCVEHVHGYDCFCHPRYTGPHCEVDKCEKCDLDADCVHGRCQCREGYVGTGYVCRKVEESQECGACPLHHHCVQGTCTCLPDYVC